MTNDEIFKIKNHIEIHARRECRASIITEILWKAVDELEHIQTLKKENEQIKADLERVEELVKTVKTCPFNICHNCEAECKLNNANGVEENENH